MTHWVKGTYVVFDLKSNNDLCSSDGNNELPAPHPRALLTVKAFDR